MPLIGADIATGQPGQSGLPSARELADELARRSKYTDADRTLCQVAGYYELLEGRNALIDFLRKRLRYREQEPLTAHRLLAQLPFRVMLTTCVDDLLERALRDARLPFNQIVGNADVAYEDQGKPLLVKMYGTLEQPDSIVFTESDFIAWLENREMVATFLKGQIGSHTLLILGHDLNDRYLKQFYSRVTLPDRHNARRSYAVTRQASDYVCQSWKQLSVEVIEGDPTIFLQMLDASYRARPVPPVVIPVSKPSVPPMPIPREPYKYLNSFEENDRFIFFGRDKEKMQVLRKIASSRMVLLYGKSGSGKTSLIQAGLVPELREGGYTAVYSRVLTQPIQTVESCINRVLGTSCPPGPSLHAFLVQTLTGAKVTTVLILDQFEELFTEQTDPATRQDFLQSLGSAYADASLDLKIVIGIREDAFAELSALKPQIPGIFFNECHIDPLTSEQARQAIVKPLEMYGVGYAEALVARIIRDLGGTG